MARGKGFVKNVRDLTPDPIYGSKIISKLINVVMIGGKRSLAASIVYGAIDDIVKEILRIFASENSEGSDDSDSSDSKKVIWFMEQVLSRIISLTEVKSKRVGGSNYRIPVPVSKRRAVSLGLRRLVLGSRNRKERTMQAKLAAEFLAIMEGGGETIRMKESLQRDIEANRAFSHYANS